MRKKWTKTLRDSSASSFIITDTNIISTFARLQQIPLLLQSVEADYLCLTPATQQELKIGMQRGCTFLQPIFDGLNTKTTFHLIALTSEEKATLDRLPTSLNAGEKESIAVCFHRQGVKILTNDKRARNFCKQKSIVHLDLPAILRRLWKAGICTKNEVQVLMEKMEAKEPGMVIKGKEEILR